MRTDCGGSFKAIFERLRQENLKSNAGLTYEKILIQNKTKNPSEIKTEVILNESSFELDEPTQVLMLKGLWSFY